MLIMKVYFEDDWVEHTMFMLCRTFCQSVRFIIIRITFNQLLN